MTNLVVYAYCACALCCGHTHGITASGAKAKAGVTCAANAYPFGTRLEIGGLGTRIVQDRLSPRFKDGRVDLFMRSHREAVQFGKRQLKVRIKP